MTASNELRLSHFGVYVSDLPAAEKFYCELLGFTVTDRGSLTRNGKEVPLIFLSRDPEEHHQIVLAGGRPAQIDFNVINQISLKANSLATVIATYNRISEGYTGDIEPVSHGNAVSFYVADPEGNRLEIYWDTPWYVSQPMREPVDLALPIPELMIDIEQQARSLPGFMPRDEWRDMIAVRMGIDGVDQSPEEILS